MRHTTRIFITLLLAITAWTAATAQGNAAIEFETKTHDFGSIHEQGGPVTYSFIFTNTGDAPLVILSASASCGCTRPKYPKKPVKPGKSEEITVTYLPANRPGEFSKEVTVKTNAPANRKVKLKISGNVIPETK